MAIRVELQLDDGQFVTRMLHAGESIDRFNASIIKAYPNVTKFARSGDLAFQSLERADQATKGFLGTMRDLTIVTGALAMGLNKIQQASDGVLGGIVRANSQFENMMALMKGMSKSTDPAKDAADNIAQIYKEANKVPFSLKEISNTAVQMKATGLDPFTGSLHAIIDAVAAVGGTDEKLNHVALAITQMSGKGVIQMEELRQQLGEALPQATALMARSMGVTYGDLVKTISTGTVAAQPALQKMFLEFERTFGGASVRRMDTFTGQYQRTMMALQTLSLRFGMGSAEAQENTFFGFMRQQLTDLNAALTSNQAGHFADFLNQKLVAIGNTIRSIINTFVGLRFEILEVTKLAGMIFAGNVMVKTIGSAVNMVKDLTTNLKLANAAWNANVQAAQRLVVLNSMGTGRSPQTGRMQTARQLEAAGFSTASSAFSKASRVNLASLSGFAGVVGQAAPLVVALGVALYATAEYFDLFGHKARDAWQEMEQFGASSRKQVDEAAKYIKRREEELSAEMTQVTPSGDLIDNSEAMKEKWRELADLKKKLSGFYAEADEAEAKRGADAQIKELDKAIAAIQTQRNKVETIKDAEFQKAIDQAKKNGDDIAAIQDKYRQDELQRNIQFYDDQLKIYTNAMAKMPNLDEDRLSPLARNTTQLIQSQLLERMKELQSQRRATQEQVPGIELTGVGKSLNQLLQNGQQELERIKEQAAGLRNELNGGTKAAGELDQALKSGKYGPENNEQVKKLAENLRKARSQADGLKEALDFMNEAQSTFDSAMKSMDDEIFDNENSDKNPAEKAIAKIKRMQQGLSPLAKVQLGLANLANQGQEANKNVLQLGSSFGDILFGTQMTQKGNNVVSILSAMVDKVKEIGSAIAGISLPGGMGKGVSGGAGGGANSKNFEANESAINVLKAFEGFAGSAYWDVNHYRAGYGSDTVTLADGSIHSIVQGMQVSREDADRDLARRINESANMAQGQIGSDAWQKWSQGAQSALTSIAYNYGSLPESIRAAAKSNDTDQLARAIRALQGDNNGVNAGRRNSEADLVQKSGTQGVSDQPPIRVDDGSYKTLGEAENIMRKKFQDLGLSRRDGFTKDMQNELQQIIEKTNTADDKVAELRQKIKAGFFGGSGNPDSGEYKKMFDALEQVTAATKRYKEAKEAQNQVNEGLKQNEKDVAKAARELKQAQDAGNKNPYAKDAEGLQAIIDKYDRLSEAAKKAYAGKELDSYMSRLKAQKTAEIDLYNRKDVQATLTVLKEKEQALRMSVGTESQIKQAQYQDEVSKLNAYQTNFKGTAAEEIAVARQVAATKKALQQQYLQQTQGAFQTEMQQWQDINKNFSQWMSNSMSSLADGITGMIMGDKVDWKSIMKKMLSDLINMSIKYLMSSIMGGKSQLRGAMGGGKGSGKGGLGGGKSGGKSMMSAVGKGAFHTGGIVGKLAPMTRSGINPAAFLGAPRFHSGGVISALGIGPDEVPIIAKKGEGVFTPEQMKALGTTAHNGGGIANTTVNTSVTVNAAGGDAKQNDDLAKKVAKQVEETMRGVVYKELRNQQKPGNMLYGKR